MTTTEYKYLSKKEINEGFEDVAKRLMKIRKNLSKDEAIDYCKNVIADYWKGDEAQSVTDKSIVEFFHRLNYRNSPMRAALYGAMGIFNGMPQNSALTINQ